MKIINPLKRQISLVRGFRCIAPIAKAIVLVSEVIVIAGPACFIASLIRFSGDNFNDC